jgi:hypothetical protein
MMARTLIRERDGQSCVPDFAGAAYASGCGCEHAGGLGRVPLQDRADRLDILRREGVDEGAEQVVQVVER